MSNNFNIICKSLNVNYDTRIIRFLPDNYQKILYYFCKNKNIIKSKKYNTTLIKLIINYFKFKKTPLYPDKIFIGGPFNVTRHKSMKYNMEIVVFGEIHSKTTNCELLSTNKTNIYKIQDFLYNIALNTDKFLDIYIETIIIDKSNKGIYKKTYTNYTMFNILSKFKKCIEIPTRINPECDLYRIHYVDARRSENRIDLYILEEIPSILDDFNIDIDSLKYNINIKDFFNKYKRLISLLMKLNKENQEDFIKVILDDILNPNGIAYKELNKSYLKDEILKFAIHNILLESNFLLFKKHINFIIDPKIDIKDKIKSLSIIKYECIRIGVYIMDIYTLSRIFKNFNVSETKFQPKSPKNIIIYTGEIHSTNYRNFLKDIGFDSIKLYTNSVSNCIEFNYKNFFN